eukprot:COSAG02_NODE_20508_length_828_cov_0.898491_1_plen_76_part_00
MEMERALAMQCCARIIGTLRHADAVAAASSAAAGGGGGGGAGFGFGEMGQGAAEMAMDLLQHCERAPTMPLGAGG